MVVTIACEHVEAHEPVEAFAIFRIVGDAHGQSHKQSIIKVRQAVRCFKQTPSGNHMHFGCSRIGCDAIESFHTEIAGALAGREQPRLRHGNAAFLCKQRQLIFLFADIHSIHGGREFDDPLFAIDVRHDFGTGAAGRAAKCEQTIKILRKIRAQQTRAFVRNIVQIGDGMGFLKLRFGLVFQCAHSIGADNGESGQHPHGVRIHTMLAQQAVRQQATPSIRHAVVEHSEHAI